MNAPIPQSDSSHTGRRRLSHVRRGWGPLDWYLETDHLLAADQRGFQRSYRRFYYDDIRAVVIWPNRQLWRRIALELALGLLAAWLAWLAHSTRVAAFCLGAATVGVLCERALGHRAGARVTTEHSSYSAPIVGRWRNAERVLATLEQRLPPAAGRPEAR